MAHKQLDERQKQIRGQIFLHLIVVMAVLFAVNGLLLDSHIRWADSYFIQNVLLILLAVTVGSLEEIFRDAYFGFGKRINRVRALLILFGAAGGIFVTQSLVTALTPHSFQPLVDRHGLTGNGTVLVMGLMYLIISISGLIKQWRTQKAFKQSENEETDKENE